MSESISISCALRLSDDDRLKAGLRELDPLKRVITTASTFLLCCRFIGGVYGRIIGIALVDLHGGVPTELFWEWIDPGALALIGAASFFGGVSRLTMSLTVIMVRLFFCKSICTHEQHTSSWQVKAESFQQQPSDASGAVNGASRAKPCSCKGIHSPTEKNHTRKPACLCSFLPCRPITPVQCPLTSVFPSATKTVVPTSILKKFHVSFFAGIFF